MRRYVFALVAAAGVLVLAAAVALRGSGPQAGNASSHREAPLISEDPTADNTDLYAFRSPDASDQLTVISNWIPAEDPAAGPNYYRFSATARYNIFVDRNGDGRPDVAYRFSFKNKPGPLFLGNTVQSYTVTRVVKGRARIIGRGVTPPDNIGPRTLKMFFGTTDYRSIAASRVSTLSTGEKVFAGQRDDAFFGDIGDIFDLVAIRRGTGASGGGKDFLAGYAVHAIALQIPISQIDTTNHVVGVWTSTDRQRLTIARVKGVRKVRVRGHVRRVAIRRTVVRRSFVQVSRLANPLVNELIIPTKSKDFWNANSPAGEARFKSNYLNPILAAVINQLYHVNAPEHNRTDIVQVLLTGVPGLNFTGNKLVEELRINLSTPPKARGSENRLGVLGNDLAGYPNGRRLGDDVIDISERAVAGALKGNNVALGDGVNQDDRTQLSVFPYEADPQSGADNTKGDQKP